jgi:energy-coupling factor transporter ATP-binding protein EcfA2
MLDDLIKIEENKEPVEKIDYSKFIVNHDDIDKDIDGFISGKIPQGFGIGIPTLDNHFLAKKNEFYIVTGKKGRGKTTVSQSIQVMQSVANGLIWVVAFQENSDWSMKVNYMNYLLGDFAKDVERTDKTRFEEAKEWVKKHFIFINVEDIKTATDVTKDIINNGTDVHALILDPINSFRNGWQDTGNGYADGQVAGINLLKFANDICSVHISQHPNMAGQRQEGAVNSYQAEGGWFLNKASFTYVLHREKGSSENELIVENVRNRLTGGSETSDENPIVLEWSPTKVNIRYKDGSEQYDNVIGYLVEKYNVFSVSKEIVNAIPTMSPEDAFGDTDYLDDTPF